jgi:hypothetical protein
MRKRERERNALTTEVHRELARLDRALRTLPNLGWTDRAALVRDAHRVVHVAFGIEPHSELHHAAAALFHRTRAAVYPPEVGDEFEHFHADDPRGLELAMQFLEADPWFFRSGYVKAELLRRISRVTLPPAYVPRLQQVVLAATDAGDRREFRRYCWAARRIDSASLRDALAQRIAGTNADVTRRAQWLLEILDSR